MSELEDWKTLVLKKWDEVPGKAAITYFENLGCIIKKNSSSNINHEAELEIYNYVQVSKVYHSPLGGGGFVLFYINVPKKIANVDILKKKFKKMDALLSFKKRENNE